VVSTKKPASSAPKASTIDANTGYAEAIEELESILAELESDDVDVDELAEHVQRASQLIELCRERISKAKLRIEEVVSQLEAD
jgi:exodeoxyribonuclease VII small subunit